MIPCRRPHRTNCCASAVPIIFLTVPSGPGSATGRNRRRCPPLACSPSPTCTCATPRTARSSRGCGPTSDDDWLIVAGDVAERVDDVVGTLALLRERFAMVVWAPGNHELWTRPKEGVPLRGEERYRHLVQACRAARRAHPGGPVPGLDRRRRARVVAPLFLLYDYSFLPDGTATAEEGLAPPTRRRGVHRRAPARARPVPRPRRVVRRPRRVLPVPARRPRPGPADGAGQPLAADPVADAGAPLPGVRAVVRHDGDRRLARPLPRGGGRLRPPAHPARDVGGRGAVRRGVAGLPARVAARGLPDPLLRTVLPDQWCAT